MDDDTPLRTPDPEERMIEGMLSTRFGRDNGSALENALRVLTASELCAFPVKRYAITAIAAALMLAMGTWWYRHEAAQRTGLSLSHSGKTVMLGEKQVFRPAESGMLLRSGESVITQHDPASLFYQNESTRFFLEPESELLVSDHLPGKNLFLSRGEMSAQVAKQDVPLRVQTPQGVAEVLGTRFALHAPPGATWLRVDEGLVRWSGLDGAPVKVGVGYCAVAAPGIAPGPYPLVDGELPATIPMTWDWTGGSSNGDGHWQAVDGVVHQSKVALVKHASTPRSEGGKPDCPLSNYEIDCSWPGSFRLDTTVTLDRLLTDEIPDRELVGGVRLTFKFSDSLLEYVIERQGRSANKQGLTYQAFAQTMLDPSKGYPTTILHGGLAVPLAKTSLHVILQVNRNSTGSAAIRGKVWKLDTPEPPYWSLQAWVPSLGPLEHTGFGTNHCAATFSHIKSSLIP